MRATQRILLLLASTPRPPSAQPWPAPLLSRYPHSSTPRRLATIRCQTDCEATMRATTTSGGGMRPPQSPRVTWTAGAWPRSPASSARELPRLSLGFLHTAAGTAAAVAWGERTRRYPCRSGQHGTCASVSLEATVAAHTTPSRTLSRRSPRRRPGSSGRRRLAVGAATRGGWRCTWCSGAARPGRAQCVAASWPWRATQAASATGSAAAPAPTPGAAAC
jgi:hypothetical protein